jgi:hypothetical protein
MLTKLTTEFKNKNVPHIPQECDVIFEWPIPTFSRVIVVTIVWKTIQLNGSFRKSVKHSMPHKALITNIISCCSVDEFEHFYDLKDDINLKSILFCD